MYHQNKNLRDKNGDTTIENNKSVRKQKPILKSGHCKPCFSKKTTFVANKSNQPQLKSNVTKKNYQVFHRLNCKSSYIIYLLECLKCHIQYVGK